MTRNEISRRLHDMVDKWFADPLFPDLEEDEVCVAYRITYRHASDPTKSITLVVGTEPAEPEDDERKSGHSSKVEC